MTKGVMNLPHRGDGWVQHTSIFDASKGCGPDAILRGASPPTMSLSFQRLRRISPILGRFSLRRCCPPSGGVLLSLPLAALVSVFPDCQVNSEPSYLPQSRPAIRTRTCTRRNYYRSNFEQAIAIFPSNGIPTFLVCAFTRAHLPSGNFPTSPLKCAQSSQFAFRSGLAQVN